MSRRKHNKIQSGTQKMIDVGKMIGNDDEWRIRIMFGRNFRAAFYVRLVDHSLCYQKENYCPSASYEGKG